VIRDIPTLVPSLKPPTTALAHDGDLDFEEFAADIYEWLSLIRLESVRVQPHDAIDPYLCRYQPPGDSELLQNTKLCKITWQGFISPDWAKRILIGLMTAMPSKATCSVSITTFVHGLTGDNSEVNILRPPNSPHEYLMWEVKSHE
jgi:ribonuclease P/MRP protein subunit RPP40